MSTIATQSAQALSHEWARVCAELPARKVAKCLNRIALNFAKLSQECDVRRNSCIRPFLEKHVIRAVIPSCILQGSGPLRFIDVLEPLQRQALLLGRANGMQPKDVSLVLNAYAKIYHCTEQSRTILNKQCNDTSRILKRYVSQMIPEAKRLVGQMNEQDLSLVLNCLSKLGVLDDELLKVANNTLVWHLRALYGHESHETTKSVARGQHNLLSQFTPQGVSLVLNCFAKSNVTLDERVVYFIVHKYLPRHINNFLTQQLAVVLHAFLKLKVPLKDVTVALRHLDRAIAAEYDASNTKLLSASLYTFGKYNYLPDAMLHQMEKKTEDKIMLKCSEMELSNMYYGLGKLNMRCIRLLEKLRVSVASTLHQFSAQGITTIYYAITRLDMKYDDDKGEYGSVLPSMCNLLLRRFEELVGLNRSTIDAYRGCESESTDPMKVLPLHLVNVCFSSATGLVHDGRRFAILLEHLKRLFYGIHGYMQTSLLGEAGHRSKSEMEGTIRHSGSAPLKRDVNDGNLIAEFITRELGTQGMYQLYCICQHLMVYTKGGLSTQRLDVLQMLKSLFEMWEVISYDKPSSFLKDPITGTDDVSSVDLSLVDPTITTSRIQADVFSVLKTHMQRSQAYPQGDSINQNGSCDRKKHPIVVTEAQATPYVIDILVCSV